MMSLPQPHGLLARLQRAWPGVVIQGGISAGSLHYRAPASSEEGTPSAAATAATNFCGLVVCKASGSGATPAPAPPFVLAALTLKTAEGADAVFAEVRLVEAAGEAFGMHPILGRKSSTFDSVVCKLGLGCLSAGLHCFLHWPACMRAAEWGLQAAATGVELG